MNLLRSQVIQWNQFQAPLQLPSGQFRLTIGKHLSLTGVGKLLEHPINTKQLNSENRSNLIFQSLKVFSEVDRNTMIVPFLSGAAKKMFVLMVSESLVLKISLMLAEWELEFKDNDWYEGLIYGDVGSVRMSWIIY